MVKSLLLPSKKATTPSVSDPSTPLIEKIAEIGYDRASVRRFNLSNETIE